MGGGTSSDGRGTYTTLNQEDNTDEDEDFVSVDREGTEEVVVSASKDAPNVHDDYQGQDSAPLVLSELSGVELTANAIYVNPSTVSSDRLVHRYRLDAQRAPIVDEFLFFNCELRRIVDAQLVDSESGIQLARVPRDAIQQRGRLLRVSFFVNDSDEYLFRLPLCCCAESRLEVVLTLSAPKPASDRPPTLLLLAGAPSEAITAHVLPKRPLRLECRTALGDLVLLQSHEGRLERTFSEKRPRQIERSYAQTAAMLENSHYTALATNRASTALDCTMFDSVAIVEFCRRWGLSVAYAPGSDTLTVKWK